MKELPPELVYGLIFAAILLYQYLTRRSRQQEPPQPESAPDDEGLPQFAEEMEETTAAPSVGVVHFGRTQAPRAADTLVRRRFSRKSLMGSKREMQNAIVIATILGPCRAFEQHDIR